MKRVLWLTSWYPHEADPFNGDFIKRQAEAVSVCQPLKIIFVTKADDRSPFHKTFRAKISETLEEEIIYYPGSGGGLISKIRSLCQYFACQIKALASLREKNEMPDLVHVQVAWKAGLIALYLKWKYQIPYILSEHWSGYYPFSRDSLFQKSFLEKYVTRTILKNASRILPVSRALGEQINQYWSKTTVQIVPNVVNTRLFFPSDIQPEIFRFVHVSTLQYPKNPEGILRAFEGLIKLGISAELEFVGPSSASLLALIQNSGASDWIHCTGEIKYEQVALEMRKSSALVLFSQYENMPCVILEALCTGLPVIASRVGGIPEVVNHENGILVSAADEMELLEAMRRMVDIYHEFDRPQIARQASRAFSYETIGREIIGVYDKVLSPF
jgi:glycosyltransferase involved in cell wall biosynthesis